MNRQIGESVNFASKREQKQCYIDYAEREQNHEGKARIIGEFQCEPNAKTNLFGFVVFVCINPDRERLPSIESPKQR